MKLFLSSMSVSAHHQQDFLALVGKEAAEIKVAFIPNGADVYPEQRRGFVTRDTDMLKAVGVQLDMVDLKTLRHASETAECLKLFDVIWAGGGNSFYLRWILRESGFDQVITDLLAEGKVYGGGSAGALVAGPTLEAVNLADKPERAPEIIWQGMGLTDAVVIPHWGHPMYGEPDRKIKEILDGKGYRTVPVTDEQAVVIHNDDLRVIG